MAVVEEDKVAGRSPQDIFASKYRRFGKENPEEFEILQNELYAWSSSVVASGLTRGENREDILSSHLDYVIDKRRKEGRQTTVDEFVEEIFSREPGGKISADEIMRRLQIG